MKITTKLLAACVMLMAVGTAAQAGTQTIYDTITGVNGVNGVKYSIWFANGFKTDASSYTLDSVTLSMGSDEDNTGQDFFVRLYTNVGGKPGELLETLIGDTTPNTLANVAEEFKYTGSSLLSANTNYLVMAGMSSVGGEYYWRYNGPNPVDSGIASYTGYAYSLDQGANYTAGGPTDYQQQMKIDVTAGSAVPEPATLLGFGLPMLMVGLGKLRGLRR